MSRFSLGLEAQEQDLDLEHDPRDVEYESLADSPLSPLAGRAFSNAVDDSDALSRMNDVLENSDVEDIPESSRAVIQESMESIRARLLGGKNSTGVAVEGFHNNRKLKIAIEENKNIIVRAWDAIVKFFKGIYDFIVGFFSKKKETVAKLKEDLKKIEKSTKAVINGEVPETPLKKYSTALTVQSSTDIQNRTAMMKPGQAVDFTQLPFGFRSDRFFNILGGKDIQISVGRMVSGFSAKESAMNEVFSGYKKEMVKEVNQSFFDRFVDQTAESMLGKEDVVSKEVFIQRSNNEVSVSKGNPVEIEITITGSTSDTEKVLKELESLNNSLDKSYQVISVEMAKTTKNLLNFLEQSKKSLATLDSDQSVPNTVKNSTVTINAINKSTLMFFDESLKAVKLTTELFETYIAFAADALKMIPGKKGTSLAEV